MRVLGIESSCDETGVAIYDTDAGLLSHQLFSQVDLHARYGGVVPELASRDHVQRLIPLIDQAFLEAGLARGDVDGVAYTAGPGLIGALMVGAMVGRSLAWAWGVPAMPVHHMEGHLLAPMLEESRPAFPFVALLVSGGHTQLIDVEAVGVYRLLGESLDDAAGEAFDKTAKLLGLPYPGGPELAKLAEQGEAGRFVFTPPMIDRPGMDFSFSGLKTAVRQAVEKAGKLSVQDKANLARGFEESVVRALVVKCRRALKETGRRRLVVAGGVSANRSLRAALQTMVEKEQAAVYYPALAFCTDNGAMIALAGAERLAAAPDSAELGVSLRARWPLTELGPISGATMKSQSEEGLAS